MRALKNLGMWVLGLVAMPLAILTAFGFGMYWFLFEGPREIGKEFIDVIKNWTS
jgi:hypothetical protein